jgi:DNA-directed RNA polymerase specialized sigma24 family protein
MPPEGSITCWLAELELGRADEAQHELWKRYFSRLAGLARIKLGQMPRSVVDEEDVATTALSSFFIGVARGCFPKLHGRDELWPLLAKITSRKAVDQRRYLLAEKRGGILTQHDPTIVGSSISMYGWAEELIDRELQPDHLLAVCEECDRLLGMLPDPQLQLIARRRLEGYTNAEIAEQLGVIERTIERRLRSARSGVRFWTSHPVSSRVLTANRNQSNEGLCFVLPSKMAMNGGFSAV